MKIVVTRGLSFKPSATPPQIDVSGARDAAGHPVAVTPATLLAVLNATNPGPVYVAGEPGLGGTWQGNGGVPTTLVLQASTIGMLSGDQLIAIIDDGRVAAGDDTLQAFEAQAHADAAAALAVFDTLATDHTLQALVDDVVNFATHNRQDLTKLDADLTSFATANHGDLTKLDTDLNTAAAQAHTDSGKLDVDLNAFASANHTDVVAASNRNHTDLVQVDTDLVAAATQAHQDSGRLDADVVAFAAASHADLGRIEALLAAQRQETLWTDDSRAYFVRLDNRGTITCTDLAGAASSAPGVGARPAAGDDALLDKSSYQAINAGPGYAVGHLIDHVITTDPKSGVIVGHFWLNITAETTIAAPAAADIEPLSRLPDDASRASLQTSIGATAHADAQKLDTDLVAASDRNHADLVALGTGATANAAQAHGDAQKLDADLTGFATANHGDLTKLDTDLITFATANHADLTTISGKVATAARQDTGNTSLATIATGIGAPADADPGSDTAAGSVLARLARLLASTAGLATLLGAIRDRLPTALVGGRLSVDGSGVVQPVSGTAAAGTAPTQPPLSVSGVDGDGLKRHIRTDGTGAIFVQTANPASIVTGQVVIATTGTAVRLPSAPLINGLVIKAKATNAGQSGTYSATVGGAGVTTVYDGTGAGYPLAPGEAASFATTNANAVYVNGTAGDIFAYEGN